MKELKRFRIDIHKLSNSEHEYQYEIGNAFFEEMPESIVSEGVGSVAVTLDKNERLINAHLRFDVRVKLECDRTLEPFDYDIKKEESLIFKFGEEEVELDDDIVMIHWDRQQLDLAPYIYELIAIAIPMKKLHPRLGEDSGIDEMIYTSEGNPQSDTEDVDPRWNKLKKLK